MDEQVTTSRLGKLADVWSNKSEMSAGEWAQAVSTAYFNCDVSLVGAAEIVGAQPAEVQAALVLASMDENDLDLVSKFNPPITTWFFIAECPREHLLEMLEAMHAHNSTASKAERAQALVRDFAGPTLSESIASLGSNVYSHLATKAEQHNALTDKSRKALRSFGARLKRGQALTPRQIAYAENLLQQLVELNIVNRKSPDGDTEIMESVLHALGRD